MTLRWNPRTAARGTVLLLHDVLSMSETWWRVGPALAAHGWRTVAPDLVGHGGMPDLSRSLDMAELVQGVVARMPGKVDLLVGHGLGAIVALSLAGRYHDAARALVLEDPPGTNRFEESGELALAGARSALVRSDPEWLFLDIRQSHPLWADQDVEYAVNGVASADVPAVLAGLRCRMEWDLRRLLAYVRVPVLVLTGNRSTTANGRPSVGLTAGDLKALEGRLLEQHIVSLNGGHHLHRDAPREWLDSVLGFADAVLPDTLPEEQPTASRTLVTGLADDAEISEDVLDADTSEGLDETAVLDSVLEEDVDGDADDRDDGAVENWVEEDRVHERRMLVFDRRLTARAASQAAKAARAAKSAVKADKVGQAAKTGKNAAKAGKAGNAAKAARNAATNAKSGKGASSKAAARNAAKAARANRSSMKLGRR